MDNLGFKPQKEIAYNKLLPYKDQLNEESNKFLAEIKFNLSRAVVFKESNPGILYWSNQLSSYIKTYGRKFSKEDHIHFIKLFYELITTPQLDPQYVHGYGHVLIRLLKKRKLITRDDLTLPWKPLYDTVEFMFYSKYESVGLKKHTEYKYQEVLKLVVMLSRVYFSVESTQEMLNEWRPLMCPYDVTFGKAIFYLSLFLPTTLPPHQVDQGFRLWFDEILGLWKTFQNPGRMWEEDCLKLLARLARDNIGYIDWDPHIPVVFTRLVKTFSLPVGSGGAVFFACKDYKAILRSYVSWIVSSLGGGSVTQEHLSKMFVSLESFYHPSNIGRYSGKLQKLLLKMSSEVMKRLHREKFSQSWQARTPEEKKLTDTDINQFVECLKPAVMLAIFNKFGSFDAANSLQHLAMMKPDLVLPTLLDKLYTALDTLIEPHQLTATLNCVTSVARALVKSDGSYSQGKSHVLPLLQLILPGIDPNDFRKSVATFTFISTIISLVPVVDCSEAVGVVEMTDEEKELCLATSQFEDFVLQFMDRCFSLIESSSFESVSELDSSLYKTDQRHSQEGIVGMGVASTFHAILMQSSPQIFKSAIDKLYNFCSTNVLEMKVAGKIAADMCRAASKTNAKETLKKFLPHCCSIIEGITSVEGMKHEEETDDQLLWNLQILSEVVRTNGCQLLSYKDELKKVVRATIHLKNKEAATLSAKLLENLLRPLSYIYPLEWKSLFVDFGKSPKDYLFIRDWGKPGDIDNLNIQWHIPSKEETRFAKEILDSFLQPEMKRVDNFIGGSETLTREELQQSLRVIQSCLSGGVLLLPSWDKPHITNIGTKTMVNRGRFHHTVSVQSEDIDMGENSRENIAELMHRLVEHLLRHREDDTRALQFTVKIYESLLLHLIGQRDEFDVRWRGAGAVKRAMEDKLAGKKKHVRALLIERVQLQHEMRILDNVSSQMTTLHKVLLDDLFTLATSEYTEVRIKAQKVMGMCIEVFDYYARSMFPSILANLKEDEDVSHEAFKGVLHILLNSRMFFLVNHYWEIMKDVWPAIIQANHSEKPTITTLISSLGDKMIKKHDTVAIIRQVPESAVKCALAIMETSNPVPQTFKGDTNTPVKPSENELQKAQQMYRECNDNNLKNYTELVEKLTSLLETENLRWRYLQLCFNFLRTLIRYDQPMPPRTVKLLTEYLNHDALAIRKMAISAVGAVLKQQKRPHIKISVNPYAIAEVPEPSESVIQPGDRPDNLWLQFSSDRLPKTQESWDQCTFIDKTHWGYYTWPKKLLTYAPADQQPLIGRTRDQLSEGEREIFDLFSQEDFVGKFIDFLSLEDRKGKDKFSVNRFLLFKGLFRNFDDSFLAHFKPHLERLSVDSQESSQRCAVEIIAALIRGSKHWTFTKTKAMWDFLIPLLRKAIPSITVETLEDWGTCMATAVESRDPRRIHWLLNALLDEPLSGESGSFADASRLYLIQGALCQQEWRVAELLHQLLSIILFRLGHSYKNVRDRSGSVLCSIFMYDIHLPNAPPTRSPKRHDFVSSIVPRLDCLMKLTTIDDGSNPTAGVDMAKVKEGSAESEAVRLLKTITNWLLTHAVRALNSCAEDFFNLLPCVILFDSQEEDPELQHHCRNTVSYMAQVELSKDLLPVALDSVKKIASQNLWYARKSILSYLQLMVFTNQFYISQNPTYLQEIQDLLFGLLLDERLEVRELAADTFSGLLHYGIFKLEKDVQDKFRKMANTKLSKKRKADGSNHIVAGNESARLLKRHAGVLGLASCVKAFPYDVPDWLPEMIIDLGNHLHDPIPIETTVKSALSSFRRTHHDNWQEHKQMFTEDQLVMLTDLLVSPCYYA